MNSTKKMTPTLSNQSKMQLTSVYCEADTLTLCRARYGSIRAAYHDRWWWYISFCALPIIYLCIFAYLKKNNELNEEDDTYTF